MNRKDISNMISVLLMISICITGMLGYIQSQLELRKFVPHRYFAYTTLSLAALHIYFNGGKALRYLRNRLARKK